jgi:hypothetical protein
MEKPEGDANFWPDKKHQGFRRASAAEDHQDFEGACEAYGRYSRPVFMHTFIKTFIRSAKKTSYDFSGERSQRRHELRKMPSGAARRQPAMSVSCARQGSSQCADTSTVRRGNKLRMAWDWI